MLKFGKLYKVLLDKLRSSDQLTYLIFGSRVWKKQLNTNWDVTTLVLKKAIDRYIKNNNKKVVDMGCGHLGLLTQYVKKNNQTNYIIGVDIYNDFVRNAEFNAYKNSMKIAFKRSNLYKNIKEKFDYVIFNPPYVPRRSFKINYPKASFSGNDGLYIIKKFLTNSKKHLNDGGVIILGVNCFYIPLENILKIIKDNNYIIKDIVRKRFNTAKAFVLSLK